MTLQRSFMFNFIECFETFEKNPKFKIRSNEPKAMSALNRSFSAPDIPSCERVYMEKVFCNRGVVHKFTFEQYLDRSNADLTRSNFELSRLENPVTAMDYSSNETAMDVDESLNSTSLNFTESTLQHLETNTNNIENETAPIDLASQVNCTPLANCKITYRGQIPVLTKIPSENQETCVSLKPEPKRRILKKLTIISIIIGLLYIPYYDKTSYNRKIDVNTLTNSLRERVINQNEQIETISYAVNSLNFDTDVQILALIGSMGVGKTLCVNILKEAFKPNQIYDTNAKEVPQLYRNVPYLIILDDLTVNDFEDLKKFLTLLPKDMKILLVLVFSVQEMNDFGERIVHKEHFIQINQKLKEFNQPIYAAYFNPVTKEIVRNRLLDVRNRVGGVDYKNIENLINEHDFEHLGLKGFTRKLRLIDVKNLVML